MIRYYLALTLLALVPVGAVAATPLTATLLPPAPSPSDSIVVDVRSELPNPCFTTPIAKTTITGNNVSVDVSTTPLATFVVCVQVLFPVHVNAQIGVLPAGSYNLTVRFLINNQPAASLQQPFSVQGRIPLTAILVPPAPTPSDSIAVDVRSVLPNPCYTTPVATTTITGKTIAVDVSTAPLATLVACIQVATSFQASAHIGVLPAGSYNLTVRFLIINQTVASLQRSFCVQTHEDFIRQLYQDLLGRIADPAGLAYWTGLLSAGNAERKDAALAFFNSPEFKDTGLYVIGAYLAVLGRDPDFGGWAFWLNALRTGTPPLKLIQQFIDSPEFAAAFGSLGNSAFVQLAYLRILGRAPDADGLSYWTGLLNSGLGRADVIFGFALSTEFQAKIRNRALSTLLYTGFLRRSPEPAGLDFWTSQLDTGLPGAEAIDAFLGSSEYALRF